VVRKLLLVLPLVFAAAGSASACTGGPITSLNISAPIDIVLSNSSTCANITNSVAPSVTPSTMATAQIQSGQLLVTCLANGSATLNVTYPGYLPFSLPITCSLATMEADTP
jgi:hypothetical protein